jgi:hypothetical protein
MTYVFLGWASLVVMLVSGGLWARAMRRVAIPEDRSLYFASWVVAFMLGVASFTGEPGWIGGVPAVIGQLFAALLIVTRLISTQKVAPTAIQVGDTIPQFTAPDEHGEIFDSRTLAGHLVLIKFFRGHW